MENKRNQTFQYLMVIGILNVIMGHVDLDTLPLLSVWFTPYSYHMALFVFISGYFYKDKYHESAKAALDFTKRKILHLFLPVYLWNIFYGGLIWVLAKYGFTIGEMPTPKTLFISPLIDGQQFVYNMGSWFVIPLFIVQILQVWIRFLVKKTGFSKKGLGMFIGLVVTFVLGAVGIKLMIAGKNSPLPLLYFKVAFFSFFYVFGMVMKEYLEKWLVKIPYLYYFTAVMGLQFLILYFTQGRMDYVVSSGVQFENGVVIPFVTAITGILFYMRIAEIFAKGIGPSKFVDLLCRNAYSIMIHQFAGFMLVKSMIGLCQKLFGIFPDFSIPTMKVNIWYHYFARQEPTFGIVYFIGGMLFPVIIGELQSLIGRKLFSQSAKQ